jgi:hypothetical protein
MLLNHPRAALLPLTSTHTNFRADLNIKGNVVSNVYLLIVGFTRMNVKVLKSIKFPWSLLAYK